MTCRFVIDLLNTMRQLEEEEEGEEEEVKVEEEEEDARYAGLDG